jgi:hypothetical protein
MHLMHPPDRQQDGLRRVEAARYALLRCLTMAMRHQMVVHLQPIGLLTQVIERRLREDTPDLARIGADMGKMQGFARTAVGANLDVMSWLAPEGEQEVALDAGVEECMAMLGSHFSFRGFRLRHAPGDALQPVSRAAIRMLLPAVLFGLTDHARSPAELVLRTQAAPETALVQLELHDTAGNAGQPALPPYRLLEWDEVEAMAAAEGATLTRAGTGARLQFRSA